nr:hypothetical protein [Streptomyces chrestomyceticus]
MGTWLRQGLGVGLDEQQGEVVGVAVGRVAVDEIDQGREGLV